LKLEDLEPGTLLKDSHVKAEEKSGKVEEVYWVVDSLKREVLVCIVYRINVSNKRILDMGYLREIEEGRFTIVKDVKTINRIRKEIMQEMSRKIKEQVKRKNRVNAAILKGLEVPERAKRLLT